MASTAPILESMSSRKLCYMVGGLAVVWVGCLAAGALSPKPNRAMQFTATKCVDDEADVKGDRWFYPRGEGRCRSVPDFDSEETQAMGLSADNIVFAVQMPHVREKQQLKFSRWQQMLMGMMMLDIEYQPEYDQEPRVELFIRARLGYKDVGDADGDWKELDQAFVHRHLDCDIDEDTKREG